MKFILTKEFQNIIPLNNWSFQLNYLENWPIEFQNLPKPRNSIYLDERNLLKLNQQQLKNG